MLASSRLWGFRLSFPGMMWHPQQFNLYLTMCWPYARKVRTAPYWAVPHNLIEGGLNRRDSRQSQQLRCTSLWASVCEINTFWLWEIHTYAHTCACVHTHSLHLVTPLCTSIHAHWVVKSQNHHHCHQGFPYFSHQQELMLRLKDRKPHVIVPTSWSLCLVWFLRAPC